MFLFSKVKYACIFSILFCIIFLLNGCASDEEIKEIGFRITWDLNSSRGDALFNIVDAYNEQSNDFHVTLIGGDEDKSNIQAALDLETVDVLMMPYRYIQDKEISTQLLTLNKYFKGSYEDYDESMILLATNSENLKGVPWIGHSMCLVFNMDLCKEADINPYEWKSLSDLVVGLEAVILNTNAKGLGLVGANHHDITWMINQFIYTFGGNLIETDELGEFKRISINSTKSIEAIGFYKNTLGQYAQDDWINHNGTNVMEAFAKSEIAFEIQGPWAITDIWKKGNPFDVGVIPLNQLGVYAEVGPIMLSISQSTSNEKGALDFVKFLNSDIGLDMILEGEYDPKYDAFYPFRIPVKKTYEQSKFYKQFPEFKVFSEGFKLPSISTPSPEWADKADKYAELLHRMMSEDITIEEGLKEVE